MGRDLNSSPFITACRQFHNTSDQVILPVEERIIKYKQKKTQQQMKNNTKSNQGFGYTYKPLQLNLNKSNTK
jgi:hypothetical protein